MDFGRNARAGGGREARRQALAHHGQQRIGGKLRLRAPLLGPAARVHQHHARAKLRAHRGHPGSHVKPLTSLIISAPAWSAARAVSAL